MRHLTRTPLTIALTVAALAAPTALADQAHEPLPALLEDVEVHDGLHYRHLTVFPICRPVALRRPSSLELSTGTALRDLELRTPGATRPESLHARNRGTRTVATVPGQYLRGPQDDFAVTRYRVVASGDIDELEASEVSLEGGDTRPEWLSALAPPVLRHAAISRGGASEMRETVQTWTRSLRVEGDRPSAVGLGDDERLRLQRDRYRLELVTPTATDPDFDCVGYVAYFGEDLTAFELYDGAESFTAAWPAIEESLATEAALIELTSLVRPRAELDEQTWSELRATAVTTLDDLRKASPDDDRLDDGHVELRVGLRDGIALAVVDRDDVAKHVLYVRDPAERAVVPAIDDFDPAEAANRGRATQEEQRLLDRKGKRDAGGSGLPDESPEPEPPTDTPTPPRRR